MSNIKNILRNIVVAGLVIAIPATAYLQRWAIYDAWQLRGYEVPQEIAQLAEQTTMKPHTEQVFYANMPELLSKESFTDFCTTGEQTIVLGCFKAFDGIYLQNITDERLNGIMQVTAAHEVLHAAYQRLEWWEKERIVSLLQAEFAQLDNERIKETIENYREQGADVNNELHSILGTEVRNLSDELEAYYAQYFEDRQKIVDYSEDYEAAFTERKEQVEKYDAQLKEIRQNIDANSAELATKQQELARQQEDLNTLLAQNRTQEYNSKVPAFNSLVQSYNNQVARIRSLIDQFNSIVKQRNEITLEQRELFEAIDSRPETFR